jgi:hypothetical protein
MDAFLTDVERRDSERVAEAWEMMQSGKTHGARELLLDVVRNAPRPEDYDYQGEDEGGLNIKFWDMEEYHDRPRKFSSKRDN